MAFGDFSRTDNFLDILTNLNTKLNGLVTMFRGGSAPVDTGAIRYSATNKKFEYYDGAAWVALDLASTAITNATNAGNADTATNASGTGTIPKTSGSGLKIVTGIIDGLTGVKLGGDGFTCSRTGTGTYSVTLSSAFSGQAMVLAGASTSMHVTAFWDILSPTNITIVTRYVDHTPITLDGNISFIAIGPN